MAFPKISIVTPCLNQAKFLERTILSVINQNYQNLEYRIIDGGSTDGSIEIIKKYDKFITYWISEKDNGQSEAINKGIKMSTGEFITWLNSDDILLPNVLNKFSNFISKNDTFKWFFGNTIWIDENDNILKVRKGEEYCSFLVKRGYFASYGPSAFFSRELFSKFGFLNEGMHYMMDTEFWLRLMKNNIEFKRLNFYCWALRLHEKSKMAGHHFVTSDFANKEHPSWNIKQNERKILRTYYTERKLYGLLTILYKLFSKNVIKGLIDNLKLKNKKITILNG